MFVSLFHNLLKGTAHIPFNPTSRGSKIIMYVDLDIILVVEFQHSEIIKHSEYQTVNITFFNSKFNDSSVCMNSLP